MTRAPLRLAAAALTVLALALPAGGQQTQPPATLIADAIRFEQGSQVIRATGSVEIFYQGARLRAAAVVYDGATDTVQVTGPITLTEESGRTVVFAEFAELSADLQNGVLRSARLVLDRQLQIAATEIERSDGRYTQLYQGVASSCEVCADRPVPLWEIRAQRVIHDQQERQLYFDNASFRVMGVPVAWVPRMRLPDPTLERATGLLTPSLRANDDTGTHLRLPYFITLGDHADLTLVPWIGAGATDTVELRYRQAFRGGEIEVQGALSRDDMTTEDQRGYLFAAGAFDLPRGYRLDFALQGVTDRGYLTTYGFPDPDLLESYVRASRATRDQYVEIGATSYVSLREGDDNETLPTQVLNAEITRRFVPGAIGGIATVGLEAFGYARLSDADGFDGRDVARLSGFLDWRRDTVLPGGLLMAVEGALYADIYNTWQDPAFDGTRTRVAPVLGVELRYPLARSTAGGVTHLIEPVVQLAWSDVSGDAVPAEDSRIVEFDEANLLALDRFPGADQRETGLRASIGFGYTRTDTLGWSLGVAAGLVLRETDTGQFTSGSGLDGIRSDYLLATHFSQGDRWRVINRALFDSALDFTSNELSLGWQGDRHALETSYTWLAADPAEDRPLDMAEWALDAEYEIRAGWLASANWRYDFVENAPTRAGLAVAYANECVDMEFSVARRYTTSTTLTPATEVGFTVSLNGFGAQRGGRSHTRSCLR
ncbi:LPS-assembly protein LptD [Roseicyclus persicicus]|uniref:LPS-assembly protein LptD n=1 Tax=Roseicyclus persicicus TaxID=2650661 RepID=A0A7X6H0U7_9RHOB|nr:LPS assembly protein LptD [Roseibacterium persicicum]NKX44737.1 LPS-assembly protein LptD [Roseibacterium persicicum]